MSVCTYGCAAMSDEYMSSVEAARLTLLQREQKAASAAREAEDLQDAVKAWADINIRATVQWGDEDDAVLNLDDFLSVGTFNCRQALLDLLKEHLQGLGFACVSSGMQLRVSWEQKHSPESQNLG